MADPNSKIKEIAIGSLRYSVKFWYEDTNIAVCSYMSAESITLTSVGLPDYKMYIFHVISKDPLKECKTSEYNGGLSDRIAYFTVTAFPGCCGLVSISKVCSYNGFLSSDKVELVQKCIKKLVVKLGYSAFVYAGVKDSWYYTHTFDKDPNFASLGSFNNRRTSNKVDVGLVLCPRT